MYIYTYIHIYIYTYTYAYVKHNIYIYITYAYTHEPTHIPPPSMRTHTYLLLVRAPPPLLLLHVLSVGAVGVVELLHLCFHLLAQEPLFHRQLFAQLHLLLCRQFVEQLLLHVCRRQGCRFSSQQRLRIYRALASSTELAEQLLLHVCRRQGCRFSLQHRGLARGA